MVGKASNKPKKAAKKGDGSKPVLLSGGNPQIPKGHGEAPVRAYLDAMPGWKQGVGRRLDALVERTVPDVRKAVKWNSPLYGAPDAPPDHWFLSFHCFDRYVKVTFFQGSSLHPTPPETSKYPDVRYFHIHEDDELDEARFADWVRQASQLPNEKM
ncbi:DUF1801 domain-containing protein [Allosphingosinicella sp.]|uniref:DUF1801 domain-containing protein n=1 Tax=Allosphingosinicella sp. TaxID=2823234 RepID=UPI002FC2312D